MEDLDLTMSIEDSLTGIKKGLNLILWSKPTFSDLM